MVSAATPSSTTALDTPATPPTLLLQPVSGLTIFCIISINTNSCALQTTPLGSLSTALPTPPPQLHHHRRRSTQLPHSSTRPPRLPPSVRLRFHTATAPRWRHPTPSPPSPPELLPARNPLHRRLALPCLSLVVQEARLLAWYSLPVV